MAEIYAEILNEVGIEARAIGIEKKGETQELSQDEAKHYCAIFKLESKICTRLFDGISFDEN